MNYEEIGKQIGQLVDGKQKQYGNSFGNAHKIIEILYPNGVRVDQYQDMLCIVRILDKLFRIAQRKEDGKDLGSESPYRDISGYGLLGTKKDDNMEVSNAICSKPRHSAGKQRRK